MKNIVTRIRITLEIGYDESTDDKSWIVRESHELYRIISYNMAKFFFDRVVSILTVSTEVPEQEKEEIYGCDESFAHIPTEIDGKE